MARLHILTEQQGIYIPDSTPESCGILASCFYRFNTFGFHRLKVLELFPSSRGLELIWSSVVKIGQSLYREAPGTDPFRPDQKSPVKNFFLAGSYTKQGHNLIDH
ncbi:zeta-carotene desaturase, chloroplastic/chromoplastic-like [Carex rostrata]